MKKKLIQNLRKQPTRKHYTEKMLKKNLKDVLASVNNTITASHGKPPAKVNHPIFDPYLRRMQNPQEPLLPFDEFFTEQMRLQKLVTKPNPKGKENYDESTYHVGDEVYIDYLPSALARSYHQKRGKTFKVSRVDTTSEPWIYELTDIMDRKAKGYFYAAELARVPPMKIQTRIRQKKGPDGKKLVFVKFRGYDRYLCIF